MPTSAVNTFSESWLEPVMMPNGDGPHAINVVLADGTYVKGTVLGIVTSGGKYAAYVDANSDGTQTAKAILKLPCVVTSANHVVTGEFGEGERSVPAYVSGVFASEDLTGMDAAGLADLGGRIMSGNLTTGIVIIPV